MIKKTYSNKVQQENKLMKMRDLLCKNRQNSQLTKLSNYLFSMRNSSTNWIRNRKTQWIKRKNLQVLLTERVMSLHQLCHSMRIKPKKSVHRQVMYQWYLRTNSLSKSLKNSSFKFKFYNWRPSVSNTATPQKN
jgi:hypothetical protein